MFNSDEQTIELSCDILHVDISELNVWYVTEESPKYAGKFEYFISDWDPEPLPES